jgi:excisionase family DNA binding protein
MGVEGLPTDLIGTREAAGLVPGCRPGRGTHVSTVVRWVLGRRLRGWRNGRHWLVSRAEVLALVRGVQLQLDGAQAAELAGRAQAAETDRVLKAHGVRGPRP